MNYRQKDKKYKLWSAMSAAILLLSFGGIASAATEEVSCGEHATYKIYDSGALIISGSGTIIGFSDNTVRVNAQTVSIDFDGDEDVTEIGEDAFANFEVLSSVVIGDGLRKIGKDAFRGCKALYNVDLPNTLTEIGESAFESAGRLERYTLPEQLKSIKARAF
ncbi:MAG: leucine-rich repeat domain-containing protein, partial [Eubacteriales bacterium]|nr:leucine-rich repeat domain-containing protein [Eubacteriales bacterium]